MKKVLFLVLLAGSIAQAKVAGPVWTCDLEAKHMSGANFGFILSAGGSEASDVTITCTDLKGKKVVKKGAMVLTRLGFGIGISFPQDMSMKSVAFGLANPDELFGDYHIGASSNATLIAVEGGVILSTSLDNGVMLEVGLYSGHSIGLSLNPAQALFLQILTPDQFKALKEQQQNDMHNNNGGNF